MVIKNRNQLKLLKEILNFIQKVVSLIERTVRHQLLTSQDSWSVNAVRRWVIERKIATIGAER